MVSINIARESILITFNASQLKSLSIVLIPVEEQITPTFIVSLIVKLSNGSVSEISAVIYTGTGTDTGSPISLLKQTLVPFRTETSKSTAM